MPRKIAITGAAGYIGQLLIERLVKQPGMKRIVAVDLKRPDPLLPGVEYVECDVRDPGIARSFSGCDTVVHLAFIVAAIHDLAATYDINMRGSRNVLAACEKAGIEKLVVASSVAAYGRQPRDRGLITEDTPLLGDNASYYLHTKRLLEEDLDVFEKRNPGVVVTRLRPAILLGPRNHNFAQETGKLRASLRIREGMFLPVVHEQDVVDAFELALERDAPGAFIISLPDPVTIEDIIGGFDLPVIHVDLATALWASRILYRLHLTLLSPDWVVSGQCPWRFDLRRSREVLGWEPRHDLAATLKDMRANLEAKSGLGARVRAWLTKSA